MGEIIFMVNVTFLITPVSWSLYGGLQPCRKPIYCPSQPKKKKKSISPLDNRVFEPASAASYKKNCFMIPAKTDVLLNFNQMVESNARGPQSDITKGCFPEAGFHTLYEKWC